MAWVSGENLASYGKSHAATLGIAFGCWLLFPYYQEFRIRTKEIDGKVSAIEEAVIASRKRASELLEMLQAMDAKLDDLSDRLQSLSAVDDVTYSTSDIRQGLKTIDVKLGLNEAPK